MSYTPDPKGLYDKYTVLKDGNPVDGFTFVLRMPDPHARVALLAYAGSVKTENPTLADEIERAVLQEMNNSEWVTLTQSEIAGRFATHEELHLTSERAMEHAEIAFRRSVITVLDSDGELIGKFRNDFDRGAPATRYSPPEDGHDVWVPVEAAK